MARAVRSIAAHVADQRSCGEFQGVYLVDSVALEELEMTLLASLPSGDRLEGLDVPADERCQRNGVVLPAAWHGLVFELHFAVLGPACGGRTLRKSPVLLPDQRSPFANAKLPGMPENTAETPDAKTPINVGVSADCSREKLDRRISVAPMMDWTDEVNLTNKIISLRGAKKSCLLYVSSGFRCRAGARLPGVALPW